jgi:hypothetical protein
MNQARISHEAGNPEAWICVCRNRPHLDGFYPCNFEGEEVEPTGLEWKSGLYVCAACGRIINPKTLEVVGQRLGQDSPIQG